MNGRILRDLSPDEEYAYVQQLARVYLNDGVTIYELAERENLTRQTISKLLKKYGFSLRRGSYGHKMRLQRLIEANSGSQTIELRNLLAMTTQTFDEDRLIEFMTAYWNDHKTLRELARQFGVTQQWLSRLFAHWQIPIRKAPIEARTRTGKDDKVRTLARVKEIPLPGSEAERERVQRLASLYWNENMSLKQLGRQERMTPDSIRVWFIRYGIPRRRRGKPRKR